jgi:hypothetical protein
VRLFEALTIVIAGQVVLAAAVAGVSLPRWMSLLPLACLAPLAAHLALEGPRWQMVPADLVSVACAASGLAGWLRRRGTGTDAKHVRRRRIAALVGVVLIAVSIALTTTVRPG